MNTESLLEKFAQRFGNDGMPVRGFFAPGRVNLIGDHIDYHGGLVFPCAIHCGTTLLIRKRPDDRINLASENFDFSASLEASEAREKQGDEWVNYPLAVLQQFNELPANPISSGFDCLFDGNLPHSAGLSSSASVEVVTGFALSRIFNAPLTLNELAQLCQRAENRFVGVQCGIMDQFAVAAGQKGHAIKLDCESLDHEMVPLSLDDYGILLINSNQKRELADSKYNERVEETQLARTLLKQELDISELTEVTPAQLDSCQHLFEQHPIEFQRARHVVTEQDRVLRAIELLKQGDIIGFGQLMFESHDSLNKDYAVSSPQLNQLVELARHDTNVIGARLTGAGFGGCTVNLVKREHINEFCTKVSEAYNNETGLTAGFIPAEPSAGVHEINL